MKVIGMLKAYDNGADDSRFLAEYLGEEKIDKELLLKIIRYLKEGKPVVGLMEWWFDFEDYGDSYSEGEGFNDDIEDDSDDNARSIGGAGYYTDGKWVWAEYLVYFLEKYPNFKLDNEFLSDLKILNYEMPQISKEREIEARTYFDNHICEGFICNPKG
jgi:hypothetical protein